MGAVFGRVIGDVGSGGNGGVGDGSFPVSCYSKNVDRGVRCFRVRTRFAFKQARMNLIHSIIDPILVVVLLLNFAILASTRLGFLIYAVAAQGILLGLAYPLAHYSLHTSPMAPAGGDAEMLTHVRLIAFTLAILVIKGVVIPMMLFRAIRQADARQGIESLVGIVPTMLLGAIGTGLIVGYSKTLPLHLDHTSNLIVPASLATSFIGFLMLTTRKTVIAQVLGYIVLENGIFIFGLLLAEALPVMIEMGVLLDLFVGVFVMGIIFHHVSRSFPAASSEHLSALRE